MASALLASCAPALAPPSALRFSPSRQIATRHLRVQVRTRASLQSGLEASVTQTLGEAARIAASQHRPGLTPVSASASFPLTGIPAIEDLPGSLAVLSELSPQNAELIAALLGPVLAVVNVLFIFRIVMSWYPQLPVNNFPYNIAYVPTEPLLSITRRIVQPVGGVDVSPVIWLAFFSFINEILLGQQGLLVLISQQQI